MVRLISVALILFFCNSAYAYVGPGVGAGVIAGIIGFLGAIFLVLIGTVYYPIKRILKKKKKKKINEQ